jgi:hypothetical protein
MSSAAANSSLDQPALRLDAGGAAITAEQARPRMTLRPLQRMPPAHARSADAKPRRCRAVACALSHRLQDTLTTIDGKRF